MSEVVIVAYRPKAGQEAALLALTHAHVPLLRRLGLATARPSIAMVGEGGVVVEVFEWADGAVARAHAIQEIQAMWTRYAEIADYVALRDLPEAAEMFATFTPLPQASVPPQPRAIRRDATLTEAELDATI